MAAKKKQKRIMVKAVLEEISAVDRPAMPDAKAVLRKRDENTDEPNPSGSEVSKSEGDNDNTMTPEQIKALQKQLERAEKALSLTGGARDLYAKFDNDDDRDAFLALDADGQASEVSKAENAAKDKNPVIYTDDKGRSFRKNDDPRLVEMAKEAAQDRAEKAEAQEVAKADRVSKRATSLDRLPGSLEDRVLLAEAVEKLDPEQRGKVNAILDAANSNLAKAFERAGTTESPNTDDGSPQAQLTALAKKLQDGTSLSFAQAYTKAAQTPEGKKLYAEHVAAQRG